MFLDPSNAIVLKIHGRGLLLGLTILIFFRWLLLGVGNSLKGDFNDWIKSGELMGDKNVMYPLD